MPSKKVQKPAGSIEPALSRMGLNAKETTTYLALLKLGPSPVRAIATSTGINRGTSYEVLRRLITLGLVSYFHKTRHQYFVAEHPEKLLALIELRGRELEQTKKMVADVLPLLTKPEGKSGATPRVRFFEGHSGIRAMLEDVLTTMRHAQTKEYHVYSSADVREHLYLSFHDFSKKRVRFGIRVKTISIGSGGKLSGLDERRWLSASEHAPTYQIIYSGKIVMISLNAQGDPVGAMIEDPFGAETQRIIFKQLWSMLEPGDSR